MGRCDGLCGLCSWALRLRLPTLGTWVVAKSRVHNKGKVFQTHVVHVHHFPKVLISPHPTSPSLTSFFPFSPPIPCLHPHAYTTFDFVLVFLFCCPRSDCFGQPSPLLSNHPAKPCCWFRPGRRRVHRHMQVLWLGVGGWVGFAEGGGTDHAFPQTSSCFNTPPRQHTRAGGCIGYGMGSS